MGRKRKPANEPRVHNELKGLNLRINEFGQIESDIDINKVNEFLTKLVPDKKLINRADNAFQQEFRHLFKEDQLKDEDPPLSIEPEEEEDELPPPDEE